jgi:thiol-disulfide isomerase/thioredoxin
LRAFFCTIASGRAARSGPRDKEAFMKHATAIVTAIILAACLFATAAPAADAKELSRQAEQRLNEADRLAGADKLAEASAVLLQAADLYEQVLKQSPDDRAAKQNLLYSLGQRGMMYIRKGQPAVKEKNFEKAAELYAAAIAAYDLAIKRQPQEKNFQVNRNYCRREWGLAQFQVRLAAKGPAYPFKLAGLDGSSIELAKHKGKAVVLEFVAGWCPSCRDSMPKMREVQQRFQGRPVQVLVLALDRVEGWKRGGSEEKSMAWAKETGLAFAWADEETLFQYGALDSIPRIFLIDRAGRIASQVAYEDREPERLAKLVDQLL